MEAVESSSCLAIDWLWAARNNYLAARQAGRQTTTTTTTTRLDTNLSAKKNRRAKSDSD